MHICMVGVGVVVGVRGYMYLTVEHLWSDYYVINMFKGIITCCIAYTTGSV